MEEEEALGCDIGRNLLPKLVAYADAVLSNKGIHFLAKSSR